MYSNNIVNFQESTTILDACTKKSGKLLNAPHTLGKGRRMALALNNLKRFYAIKQRNQTKINDSKFVCIVTWFQVTNINNT